MASSDYRLVVREGTDRTESDHETYHDAYRVWRWLADYGRDGVTPTIERYLGGTWVEVDPATGEVPATPEHEHGDTVWSPSVKAYVCDNCGDVR